MMSTIIYSAAGITLLVGISFLFSQLGDLKENRITKRLAELRKKLVAKNNLLYNDRKEYGARPFSHSGVDPSSDLITARIHSNR